jgi:uncharacterized OsmC-like protein
MNNNSLISAESINAYKERLKRMNSCNRSSSETFIDKYTAVSEQVENLHVKAKVGDFEVESDEPNNLGGFNKAPNPMQLLIASIANCLELTALTYFSFSNLKVNSVKVEVSAYYDKAFLIYHTETSNGFPGFYDFECNWIIETDEKLAKIEKILEKIKKICPVKGTIVNKNSFSHKIQLE